MDQDIQRDSVFDYIFGIGWPTSHIFLVESPPKNMAGGQEFVERNRQKEFQCSAQIHRIDLFAEVVRLNMPGNYYRPWKKDLIGM
ncbi:MAG: hypothetical protein EBT86_02330 [Actinobacteria bacterium]|nr:hypothetical protein [Actinomycetota bacterium]NDG27555.1 hypothetical protein [Pseudomonadota bacterium]